MIQSYTEYKEALKIEGSNISYISALFDGMIHPLTLFKYWLRTYEYTLNNKKLFLRKTRLFIARIKFRKYSIACSFTIPINSFDVGLKLPHYGGIIVNGNVKVGKNCSIRPFTVIGNKKEGNNDEVPMIGDDVTIGCNASIIGRINIGSNVTIGAGSVVITDIPDNCVAVGNPARIINHILKEENASLL